MRKIFFFLLCFLLQISVVFSADIMELRKLYYQATAKRNSADKFMKVMELMPIESDPLLLCYKGMAHLIQANYSYNPYNKLSYFNKGKEMLEKAVEADPQNVEIRFMRFCVQRNAPFFLGYGKDVNFDKAIILKQWDKISDIDLKTRIRNYLLESDCCTDQEKTILR